MPRCDRPGIVSRVLAPQVDADVAPCTSVGSSFYHPAVLYADKSGVLGVLYEAEDTRFRRHVAVKVLRSAIASDVARRAGFERKVQALAASQR